MRFEDVLSLVALGEQEWIEVKDSLGDPKRIGDTVAAVGNGALLNDQPHGWIVWGFHDTDRRLIGTSFHPDASKVGGESLKLHLARQLTPRVELNWEDAVGPEGQKIVVLRIAVPEGQPLAFAGTRRCRIGPHNQSLSDHPSVERKLFAILSQERAEDRIVHASVPVTELGVLLDLEEAARLLEVPVESVVDTLTQLRAVKPTTPGSHAVTTMALLLFGRDLRADGRILRHTPRVVFYTGTDRVSARGELEPARGFALEIDSLLREIMNNVPHAEQYVAGRRARVPVIPELAVREVLVNALIHQDLLESGAGPLIEVFIDRLEVSNPGRPLINDVRRLLDLAPQSRNEGLAVVMRRMRFAEERGSGIDKIVLEMESAGLPAPIIDADENRTRVTLWGPRAFAEISSHDRLVTIYFHACIRWISGRQPTRNQSVRERFGLGDEDMSTVSRLLKKAVDGGWIRPFEEGAGRTSAYLPFWAQ